MCVPILTSGLNPSVRRLSLSRTSKLRPRSTSRHFAAPELTRASRSIVATSRTLPPRDSSAGFRHNVRSRSHWSNSNGKLVLKPLIGAKRPLPAPRRVSPSRTFPEGPLPTMSTPYPRANLGDLLLRAFRLRCPRCGEGKLFAGWFEMHAKCSNCRLKYERRRVFPGIDLHQLRLHGRDAHHRLFSAARRPGLHESAALRAARRVLHRLRNDLFPICAALWSARSTVSSTRAASICSRNSGQRDDGARSFGIELQRGRRPPA